MAVTGLLALLDDITMILEDVATMSKVAAMKTAGIAGDDLAVNAQGLVGLDPERELPVVGRVALGSVANKCLLIPLALLLPKAVITPLLMLGGAFLCYEGLHKVLDKDTQADEERRDDLIEALKEGPDALVKFEREKIKQAIFTDVILSAEIVAVTLGAVADQPLATKAGVLTVVALAMTVVIYGLVATIVKLDDIGLHLEKTGAPGGLKQRAGVALVRHTPKVMKGISVLGTGAMFLVGGGIFLHGIPGAEVALHHLVERVTSVGLLKGLLGLCASLLAGVALGAVALTLVAGVGGVVRKLRPAPAE